MFTFHQIAILRDSVANCADTTSPQVPDNYLRAIFGSYLASRFIYTMGISASPVSFFAFMNQRMGRR